MFGIRFIKVQPTTFLLQYRNGKLQRKGAGLSFFYFAPTTSLVAIDIGSTDIPFIFDEITADFQQASVQGQVTFRIVAPEKLAGLLNFTLAYDGVRYVSDDPQKLPQRVINTVQVLMKAQLQKLSLRETLTSADTVVAKVREALLSSPVIESLGLEILGLSILAIRPNPEIGKALEAQVRELLLKEKDEATYARRNAAVEQERMIKENELNTEIAVENKKRQILEAKMDSDKIAQERKHQMQAKEMSSQISLEEEKKQLVLLSVENSRQDSDARAYGVSTLMKAVAGIEPKVLQALTSSRMEPKQLIAQAFRELAEGAEKIGQLNVSPDLLRELIGTK